MSAGLMPNAGTTFARRVCVCVCVARRATGETHSTTRGALFVQKQMLQDEAMWWPIWSAAAVAWHALKVHIVAEKQAKWHQWQTACKVQPVADWLQVTE